MLWILVILVNRCRRSITEQLRSDRPLSSARGMGGICCGAGSQQIKLAGRKSREWKWIFYKNNKTPCMYIKINETYGGCGYIIQKVSEETSTACKFILEVKKPLLFDAIHAISVNSSRKCGTWNCCKTGPGGFRSWWEPVIMQMVDDLKYTRGSKSTQEWLKKKRINVLQWTNRSQPRKPQPLCTNIKGDFQRAAHKWVPANLNELEWRCKNELP